MKCVFSVDVEDWFHILDVPSSPDLAQWGNLSSRVEQNFRVLLETFEQKGVTVTCFFLGWIAERFPSLVREAVSQGHEIASHGYAHKLTYQMTSEAFYQDAVRSKKILEDIAGRAVWGYRAAGFSATHNTDWFFDKLIDAGYLYDSSVFPAERGHGGMAGERRAPFWIMRPTGQLFEFPISIADVMGRSLCFFGGGYLRVFPYGVIRHMTRNVLSEGRPVIFYIHPREIDPEHPRLPMNWKRRFKSYVNLKSTMPKIGRLLTDFPVTSFERLIDRGQMVSGTSAGLIEGLQRMAPMQAEPVQKSGSAAEVAGRR